MGEDRDFVFVGNYLCLDFVNTQVIKDGRIVDLVSAPEELFEWLAAAGVVDDADRLISAYPVCPEGRTPLEEARRLRGVIGKIAADLAGDGRISQASLDDINAFISSCRGHMRLEASGDQYRRVFVAEPESPYRLLYPIAESAADLVCNGDPTRVRRCANPNCILYFYDVSKSHSRRWCSMSMCGNRVKVAAHYHRHRS